jgi:TM2 domain-containing membrane protein YozV
MANGILAAILSFLIPGLGQAYAGDFKKGIIFFIVALVMILIATFVFKTWVVYLINIIISLYAAYDAYKMYA